MKRAERLALAKKRLASVLSRHVIATDRTLEQKISDAGPSKQRIEPKVLGEARSQMEETKHILVVVAQNAPWFYLRETADDERKQRLEELEPIYAATQDGNFRRRMGQTLEIIVYKALEKSGKGFFGGFTDLEEHDDSTPYQHIAPPSSIGGKKIKGKGKLDFVAFPNGLTAGIELKNVRQWVYPDTVEVKDLLRKCCDLDCIPVLIARRIPFITFRLLNLSGAILHQTYNQFYPTADTVLAATAKEKTLLGYHDIRVGNEPDARMTKFIQESLPEVAEETRAQFDKFKDVHREYGAGNIEYAEWRSAILVRRGIWGLEQHPEAQKWA